MGGQAQIPHPGRHEAEAKMHVDVLERRGKQGVPGSNMFTDANKKRPKSGLYKLEIYKPSKSNISYFELY